MWAQPFIFLFQRPPPALPGAICIGTILGGTLSPLGPPALPEKGKGKMEKGRVSSNQVVLLRLAPHAHSESPTPQLSLPLDHIVYLR